jgi:uncharacterized phage protein gp47/JayE
MTTIPTLKQLYDGIITDLNMEFGININPFGKAWLRASAAVQAGKLKLLYLALGLLQKNIWVDTADPVSVGGTLERFGFTKLGRLPYPATQGQYNVTVTGTIAAVIPALTTFRSNDDSLNPGFLYILDTAHTMTTTSDTVTLRALTAGTSSLLEASNTLTSTSPIPNVSGTATVVGISVNPIQAETTEQYRAKAIQAYQLSPQGGSSSDYRLWGLDAAGTRQIYPYADSGAANEINIFVEALPADSTDGFGTPTGTILTDVENDIEYDPVTGIGRRPLGVFAVNVQSIVLKSIDITIDSGGTITPTQETTITTALTESIYNIRPFIPGADNAATRNDRISTFGIGNIIIDAVGTVIISSIVLDVDGTPEINYLFDNGEIPYVLSITFL